jgi:hypothetical protein
VAVKLASGNVIQWKTTDLPQITNNLYHIKFFDFMLGTPVSSNNKADRHDIAEIFLKVA